MMWEELIAERDMYKNMYHKLGARVSDAIEVCKDPIVKNILINAHRETEKFIYYKRIRSSNASNLIFCKKPKWVAKYFQ